LNTQTETTPAASRPGRINRTVGWMGIKRGHRANPVEWLAEKMIFGVSLSAIMMVFLIFAFVTREALPVILGRTNTAAASPARPVEDMDKMSSHELQEYLELTPAEFAQKDKETLKLLMEVKVEASQELRADKDSAINTSSWHYLLHPHQWTGYDKPVYIWQPVSQIAKYNILPLIVGSLKATLIAMLFGVPVALGAAIYVSQLATPRLREWLKPIVELLAGIPSVVLGFFALMVMASFMQPIFGYTSRLNALVAGLALSVAIIPVIFSIAEDALTSVPRSYTQAALALGASRWKAAWQVVLPAAIPGVFAAVVLGFGRAIGETMVVLMASGNASILSWSLFDSTRTITATIAAELAETVFGGTHYRILFLIGSLLFVVTFLSNMAGEMVIHNLKRRLEGKGQ
jgi:phosphate transport system permease protein